MERKISKKVADAGQSVPGFLNIVEEYRKCMIVNGLSHNTFVNYTRKLADLALHFKKLPEKISETELRDYLSAIIQQAKSPSKSEFKFTVYSMRYYFKMIGLEMNVKLPQIKREKRLPVVLSKEECRIMFNSTKNLKHRLVLLFIYSAGLRRNELIHLKWKHLDIDRKTMLIERSKGNKDRYVPLSEYLLNELLPFLFSSKRTEYIFTGGGKRGRMSTSGLTFLFRKAVKRAGILKERLCLHSLRHSFASHLIEDGLDIVSIKELLGHTRLESTLVYLQVTDYANKIKVSPLDNLINTKIELDLLKLREKLYEISSHISKNENSLIHQLELF